MLRIFISGIILSGLFHFNISTGDTSPVVPADAGIPAAAFEKAHSQTEFSYDLDHPSAKWQLPDELFEISGNTWVDKDHLVVIEDLHPMLYLLNISKPTAVIEHKVLFSTKQKTKFDIEDVTIANNIVYALWSHGSIYKIENWQSKSTVQRSKTFLSKGNNAEGLCYDPVTGNLLVALKKESAAEEEKKSTKAVYEYDVKADTLKDAPFMLIKKKDLHEKAGEKIKFYPSAIAVHPVTKDIYILSTRDTKCMAVFSHGGQLKSFQFIDASLLAQPEGICFSPEGILFISSEGKKGKPAVLCRFDPKK